MYYAGLFENFNCGKEIRLNAMGDWLLKRERAFFTRVNDNLKQQNDGYIRSGLIGSGCTFLQQCAPMPVSSCGPCREGFLWVRLPCI